ncbi:DNA translocase FtsK [Anoxybacillus flavithermus]|uniref:DNA translocase FtsK n=2 Tax=Anoxybacillaceae TaxID=3120669 RepID=A0AAX1ZZE7_9BACL|nr:DNA translocase FtsK [Anoxybacillus flavithermus]
MTSLTSYYDPVIRTITPISGFNQFEFQQHETSTWLRNNIQSNQALVLIINKMTPEAQSLENLFAIDESYLLSQKGLDVLYELLADEFRLATDEIKELKIFLEMMNGVAEPQLRNLVEFVVSILNDNGPAIIHKIQHSLPIFGLFRDSKLQINKKRVERLRSNYMLANLQKGSSLLDTENLLDKLNAFLEYEESNNWISELWDEVSPEQFRKEAISFIRSADKALLKYDYEIIEGIFNFKVKRTLVERVRDILSPEQREDKEKIERGLEAINREENPEDIQEFVEEYGKELSVYPSIIKSINRLVEKLKHPSEYEDIHAALLYEGFILIDENIDKKNLDKGFFRLRLDNSKVSEKAQKLLVLYFRNLSNIIPIVQFDERSIPQEYFNEASETDITFELSLIVDEQILGSKKFKVLNFTENEAYQLLEEVQKDELPYVRVYSQQEVEKFDVKRFVENKVKHYMTAKIEGMGEHFERFSSFIDEYLVILKGATKEGLCNIDYDKLNKKLLELLSNIYSSVNVVNSIYKGLQYIGVIDIFNLESEEASAPCERIVSVFNPIRLLSYGNRMKSVNQQLEEWLRKATEEKLTIYKIDDYLNYIIDRYSKLSPRYFVNEDEQTYLLEVTGKFGNGLFVTSTQSASSSNYLAKELSSEVVNVVKNYLEVYPYAKDGLDLLFLYCQGADIVTKTVDELFRKIPKLSKLKLTVHSTQAAQLHKELNSWIELREEYRTSEINKKFPKLEINILDGKNIREISSQVNSRMFDADMVVLMDYFGQNDHVRYMFQKIKPENTDDWFIAPYKEPLSDQEAIKRIPYVSDRIPEVLQHFYQMQYIIHSKCMPSKDEIHLLNVTISASHFSDGLLIDFMHDHFNWVMIIDRFLDKSLLQKASSKAQIIQYKSRVGKTKSFRLILSSSEYIRKLSNDSKDHAYYDRLYKKLSNILKNNNIHRDVIIDAVNKVKDISGALVLKVIGPGKYAHEMLATYLSIEKRKKEDAILHVWSLCDELPWFSSNKRRPDLISTIIYMRNGKIVIDFEVIELKFVSHLTLERERLDAFKQVEVGLNEYKGRFLFSEGHFDAAYWRDELVHYLIEKRAYSPEQVEILKQLQRVSPNDIEVNLAGSIDVYCYTSNLTDRTWKKVQEGVYIEVIDQCSNFIHNRHYILHCLGADEDIVPQYEEHNTEDGHAISDEEINSIYRHEVSENHFTNAKESEQNIDDEKAEGSQTNSNYEEYNCSSQHGYPEELALQGVSIIHQQNTENYQGITKDLEQILVRNFLRNGLNIKIKENIVGSSVIRFYLDVPSEITTKKITSRSQDIQVWLKLNNEPNFAIDNRGIYMDIVREKPDTIYFEEFMKLVREQLGTKINNTNLIAPLGLDPLNNVVSVDLSDSTTPHLLVGGTTGSGKSVTLNSIILSIMCLYNPEDVQFLFIDPKQVEFNFYENKKHTMRVITDIHEAVKALESLVDEMDMRYSMMNKEYVSNLEEFISITGQKLPRIVVVFDEFADFMIQDKEVAKRVETSIQRLGQKARAAGIHLIICTQYPKAEIINTKIRSNLPGRLALKAADAVASHVILDQEGAEKLAGKGDFLARTDGNPIRGKSPYLTPEVKRALLKYFEKNEASR